MNVKILMLAAGVAFGAVSFANAQTVEQQATIDAQIAQVSAICAATPEQCAVAMEAALAALADAGITGAALDRALGGMAAALTGLAGSLPAAALQIASALQVVADAAPEGSPLALALAEIVAALNNGEGALFIASVPSLN